MKSGQRRRIEKVRLDTLRVPPPGTAQRAFREAKANKMAAEFDIDSLGLPVVCRVEEVNWLVDGQHRVAAIQKAGHAKSTDSIDCEVYEGLALAEMARLFLGRNDSTPVTAFERFGVAVTAGYATETAIKEIVEKAGLKIGYPGSDGNIFSVGALRRVYNRYGAKTLERVLNVLRSAYNRSASGLGTAAHRRHRTRDRRLRTSRRQGPDRGTEQGAARSARSTPTSRGLPSLLKQVWVGDRPSSRSCPAKRPRLCGLRCAPCPRTPSPRADRLLRGRREVVDGRDAPVQAGPQGPQLLSERRGGRGVTRQGRSARGGRAQRVDTPVGPQLFRPASQPATAPAPRPEPGFRLSSDPTMPHRLPLPRRTNRLQVHPHLFQESRITASDSGARYRNAWPPGWSTSTTTTRAASEASSSCGRSSKGGSCGAGARGASTEDRDIKAAERRGRPSRAGRAPRRRGETTRSTVKCWGASCRNAPPPARSTSTTGTPERSADS